MRGARAQVKGCEGGQGERVEGGTKLKRTEQESFVWRYIQATQVPLQSFALSPVCGNLPTRPAMVSDMVRALNMDGVLSKTQKSTPEYRVMVCAGSDHLPYHMNSFIEFFGEKHAKKYWHEAYRVRVVKRKGPPEEWRWRFSDFRAKCVVVAHSEAAEHRVEQEDLVGMYADDTAAYVQARSEYEFKQKYGEGPHWARWQRSKVVSGWRRDRPRVPAGHCRCFADASEDECEHRHQAGELSSLAIFPSPAPEISNVRPTPSLPMPGAPGLPMPDAPGLPMPAAPGRLVPTTATKRDPIRANRRFSPSEAWLMKGSRDMKPMNTFTTFSLLGAEKGRSTADTWLDVSEQSKLSGRSAGAAWLDASASMKAALGRHYISGSEWLRLAPEPRRCGRVTLAQRVHVERRVLLTVESDLRLRSKAEFEQDFGKESVAYWDGSLKEESLGELRMVWGEPMNLLAFYKLHRHVSGDWGPEGFLQKWEEAPRFPIKD